MPFLILLGIIAFMIFGVFPLVLMGYATIRDKREKAQEAHPDVEGS